MIILFKLISAHLIGDFLLQPKKWIEEKEKKKAASPKLYLHALIHSLLVLLLLWDISLWLVALVVGLIHLVIDMTKLYLQNADSKIKWFAADQFMHLIALLLIWKIWFAPEFNVWGFLYSQEFWLYFTAVLFITFPAGIIMKILLKPFSSKLKGESDDSLNNAGKIIGVLERVLTFTFILTGHWEAVGFLIAAKSVFRFGDLKESGDRKLTEYILIGTLLSFGIAIFTALLVEKIKEFI